MEHFENITGNEFPGSILPTTNNSDQGCSGNNQEGNLLVKSINIPGVVIIMCFYMVIFICGVIATWRKTGHWITNNSSDHVVANRNINLWLGIMTLTATTIGGGYINGTAEYVYTPGYGLVWTQAPFLFSIAMSISGLVFAKKMREKKYLTMVDPFEKKYGYLFTTIAYVPVAMGDIFWAAAILSALGSTLSVIIGLSNTWAIVTSAFIAMLYTLLGGLNSVIYTDVIQLTFITIGMWVCIPFALMHESVKPIGDTAWGEDGWMGQLKADYWLGNYIDSGLMLLFGGSAWSPLYQRVLSQKSARKAEFMCYAATVASLILSIPPILIGAVAKSTDWNSTSYAAEIGCLPVREDDYKLILPIVLYYLTPRGVAILGLGAVSAAVMSSCDSAILSTASIFSLNIYKPARNKLSLFSQSASESETLWSLRTAVLVTSVIATLLAIYVNSIYGLFFLAGDLNYTFLFPMLISALYFEKSNTYGVITGAVISFFLRFTAGEPILSFPAAFKYPWYDEGTKHQLFPFRTLTMLLTLITSVAVSYFTQYLFENLQLNPKYDVFECFTKSKIENDQNNEREEQELKRF